MPNGITINPNQPRPVVLSSALCPPPVWPLPLADWVMLPVVPEGFPTGPFPTQIMGPISDGIPPIIPPCPGTDIVVPPLTPPIEDLRERREEIREARREAREEIREERREEREERREERALTPRRRRSEPAE